MGSEMCIRDRPKCVDVSSGIEKIIGHKDHNLMSDFVEKIRAY